MRPLDHILQIVMTLHIASFVISTISSPGSHDICDVCKCDEDGQTIACSIYKIKLWHLFYGIGVYTNITSLEISDDPSVILSGANLVLRNDSLGKHFPRLREVSFLCYVRIIEEGVFQGLPHLKATKFRGGGLWQIPTSVLAPVANSLTELEISDQIIIDQIPFRGFANFSHLITLTLSGNSIKYLNSDSLFGLINLQVLNLESNKIKFVAEDAFIYTRNLVTLKLGLNDIPVIPLSVDYLNELEELDMSSNIISDVRNFGFLSRMPNLRTLNLGNNTISRVNDTATDFLVNSSVGPPNLCDNPYTCDEALCSFMLYVIGLPNTDVNLTSQICNYECSSAGLLYSFKSAYSDVCIPTTVWPTTTPSGIPVVVKADRTSINIIGVVLGVLASCGVIFGIIVFLALRRLRRLRLGYIFAGLGNIQLNGRKHPDIKFDAMVYHHNNEAHFVEERLRPRLEEDPNNFRLCLPLIRDFRLGAKRLNNLRESLVGSRCAIFVISHAFVQDARCKQAFEVACDYLHRDDLGPPHLKQTGLILLLLDPVLLDMLPEALRVLVDRLVTLEWNNLAEERCWDRLEQNLKKFRDIEHEDNV